MKYRFVDGFFFGCVTNTGISVLFPDCYCLTSGGSHHIWCDIMQIFASVVGAVFKIMQTQTGRFHHNPDMCDGKAWPSAVSNAVSLFSAKFN